METGEGGPLGENSETTNEDGERSPPVQVSIGC